MNSEDKIREVRDGMEALRAITCSEDTPEGLDIAMKAAACADVLSWVLDESNKLENFLEYETNETTETE